MLPKDEEDFSTLQPSDLRPEPAGTPATRQPEPPPRPRPALAEPPAVYIFTSAATHDICSPIPLSERARQATQSQKVPIQFLDHLIREQMFEDATRFLAHALPQREAIGWAYSCARQAHANQPSPQVEATLAVAADWVLDPGESLRLVAWKAVDWAGLATPAGRVCAAVFLTAPDHDLPVPLRKPGKNYAAIGVTASVLCSAVWENAEKNTERIGRFLAEGRKVAGGARPWETGK